MPMSHYDTLGVSRDADEKVVRRAFRRMARKYHPDLNPGDEDAERRFKEINEAYEVLSDPEKRGKYDRFGDNWKHADQMGAGFGSGGPFEWTVTHSGGESPFGNADDLLNQFFGGRRRRAPAHVETTVEISLEEAFHGAKRLVTYTAHGRSRRLEVSIPPGVDNGSTVRISPDPGQQILINIVLTRHPRLERKGNDLYLELPIPVEDAILGAEIDVPTLTGRVRLTVPAESQNGQRVRLAGQGMPNRRSPSTRGDLYVVLRPTMPKDLTEEERKLVQRLRELRRTE